MERWTPLEPVPYPGERLSGMSKNYMIQIYMRPRHILQVDCSRQLHFWQRSCIVISFFQ